MEHGVLDEKMFDHAPVSTWTTQIGLGTFFLFFKGKVTRERRLRSECDQGALCKIVK